MLSMLACSDIDVCKLLSRLGIKSIAIYGLSYSGKAMYCVMKQKGVCVLFGIDKNAQKTCYDLKTIELGDCIRGIDAIIVTIPFYLDEIRQDIAKYTSTPVISINDFLREILMNGNREN